MGAASAAVYAAQAAAVGALAGRLPEESRPLVRTAARLALGTTTAVVATGCAALVYLVVWRRWRRGGWWTREGVRVGVCGAVVWAATAGAQGAATAVHLVVSRGSGGLSAAGAGAPPLLLAALPVVVYATAFGRCARQYHRDGRWDAAAPERRPVARRPGTWRL